MFDPITQFVVIFAIAIVIFAVNRAAGLSSLVMIFEINAVVIGWTGWRVYQQDYLFLQPCLISLVSSVVLTVVWLFQRLKHHKNQTNSTATSVIQQVWFEIKTSTHLALRLYLDIFLFVVSLGKKKIKWSPVETSNAIAPEVPQPKKQSPTEKWLSRHDY